MIKNIGKLLRKNLSSKYIQKRLDHAKESVTDALKTTSNKAIQETSEVIGNLIGNKIADKITKVSKTSLQNSFETATNEYFYELFPEEKIESY